MSKTLGTIIGLLLLFIMIVLIGSMYAGVGWLFAWVLEAGLNLNVNYAIFIIAALVIYAIKLIPAMIGAYLKVKG